MDAIRKAHPEVPDINGDVNDMSQSTRDLLRQERAAFRIDHSSEWGRIIAHSLREVVAQGLAREPGQGPAEGGTKWPPT